MRSITNNPANSPNNIFTFNGNYGDGLKQIVDNLRIEANIEFNSKMSYTQTIKKNLYQEAFGEKP